MKKVFLEDLPRKNSDGINWKLSVGKKVKFIYENIKGEVEILYYNTKNRKITIKYKNTIFDINTNGFSNCNLGELLGVYTKEYLYSIGDKVGNLEILDKIKIKNKNEKGYKYKCTIHDYIGKASETSLKLKKGCPICSNKIIVKGINDIATTHPHLIKYFVNIEDAYKYSYGSGVKVKMKCQDCGHEDSKPISVLYKNKFTCNICSDGKSYSEKLIAKLLLDLKIDFNTEHIFKWAKNKKYDFYISSLNCIVETHGIQHYEKGFDAIGNRTLEEEQENDRVKEILAKENGIDNYIVIDCRKSEIEWIKNKIQNSRLNKILDLSNINWSECEKYASGSLLIKVCKLWDTKLFDSTSKLGGSMMLSSGTIRNYLKRGVSIGLCTYNPKEEIIKNNSLNGKNNGGLNAKKVICLNNNKIYPSATEAGKDLNINISNISSCCRKLLRSAGRDKNTNEKLVWMYYHEYQLLKEDV